MNGLIINKSRVQNKRQMVGPSCVDGGYIGCRRLYWMAAILDGGHIEWRTCWMRQRLHHQGTLIRDGYESSTAFFLGNFFLHTTSL